MNEAGRRALAILRRDGIAYEDAQRGTVLGVPLWYPDTDNDLQAVQIDLIHVRFAEPIRIWYDFARNGYAVERRDHQQRTETWSEVAFVSAIPEDAQPVPDAPFPMHAVAICRCGHVPHEHQSMEPHGCCRCPCLAFESVALR